MAKTLPPPGPLPAGEHAGCDTSGMLLVHRIFRWLYRELPQLVREVEPGDTARSAIVGRYAHLDFFALHMHHETEDMVLWDRLEAREPGCALHVGQMRGQHAEVAGTARADRAAAGALGRQRRSRTSRRLRQRHRGAARPLGAHLGQEEDDTCRSRAR